MNAQPSEASAEEPGGLRFILRALRYRNYRLFFSGQSVSLIGTWMQRLAVSWLVFRLTGSPFWLGVVGFMGQIPTFLLAPIAGVITDRWNPYRILVGTQVAAMLQALALAALVLTHTANVWYVLVLSAVLGCINAFDVPARQSYMIEMIERREDLSNAIALNSSMVNGARLVGPSVAGLVISALGEGLCFLLNGLSYIAVLIALFMMTVKAKPKAQAKGRILHNLQEGVRYAFGFPPIREIILLLGLISLVGMPYTVLMPVFAKDILHGGPHTLGFLSGTTGIGALLGALYLASRNTVLGLGRIIAGASALFGAGLIVFSLSTNAWLSYLIMIPTGLGMMLQMAASNTVLQTIVDDDKRGRVMSFYTMAFMGTAPFGSLIAGAAASRIGAPNTLLIGGILCILGAASFAIKLPRLREHVRPIYIKMGILPEIASGLQMAADPAPPAQD
jgi:MFS family permease